MCFCLLCMPPIPLLAGTMLVVVWQRVCAAFRAGQVRRDDPIFRSVRSEALLPGPAMGPCQTTRVCPWRYVDGSASASSASSSSSSGSSAPSTEADFRNALLSCGWLMDLRDRSNPLCNYADDLKALLGITAMPGTDVAPAYLNWLGRHTQQTLDSGPMLPVLSAAASFGLHLVAGVVRKKVNASFISFAAQQRFKKKGGAASKSGTKAGAKSGGGSRRSKKEDEHAELLRLIPDFGIYCRAGLGHSEPCWIPLKAVLAGGGSGREKGGEGEVNRPDQPLPLLNDSADKAVALNDYLRHCRASALAEGGATAAQTDRTDSSGSAASVGSKLSKPAGKLRFRYSGMFDHGVNESLLARGGRGGSGGMPPPAPPFPLNEMRERGVRLSQIDSDNVDFLRMARLSDPEFSLTLEKSPRRTTLHDASRRLDLVLKIVADAAGGGGGGGGGNGDRLRRLNDRREARAGDGESKGDTEEEEKEEGGAEDTGSRSGGGSRLSEPVELVRCKSMTRTFKVSKGCVCVCV